LVDALLPEVFKMTPERDPRIDPAEGDVLLQPGETCPLVVGHIGVTGIIASELQPEIWYGYGYTAYYWTPLDKWRERMKDTQVIYAAR
jgi:hypothetical protein